MKNWILFFLTSFMLMNCCFPASAQRMDPSQFAQRSSSEFEPKTDENHSDQAGEEADIARISETAPEIPHLQPGNMVAFGRYEQDNDPANGPEPIEWQVLAVEDGKALLISKYGLDMQQYNPMIDYKTLLTWEECSLRAWLNEEFYENAFSETEKSSIPCETINNPDNPKHSKQISYKSEGGNDTEDAVFLLSLQEADRYFGSDADRQCFPTAYAVAQGAYAGDDGTTWWWLRSPGKTNMYTGAVNSHGEVDYDGPFYYSNNGAVRPVIRISLEP